uniref:Uncharacterized protein n=1 Tax=Romanomermis culicivorax TaxID=13658 RepID=A0A915KPU6_ROMCU
MSVKSAQTDRLSAGRQIPCTDEIRKYIDTSGEEGYDFTVAHIAYPWCCLDAENLPEKLPPISRPDLILRSSDWSRLIVAKISPWIDVDSKNKKLRLFSQQALQEELSYYSYLCVPAILLELKRPKHPNLAKMINDFLESTSGPVVWAVVPTTIENSHGLPNGMSSGSGDSDVNSHLDESCSSSNFDSESEAETDTWYWFQRFRTACDNKLRLGAVLKLTSDLPENPEKLKRWMGEPLKAFTVDTSIFLTNDKRFPVLTKGHQAYIKQLFTLKIQALVTGRALHVRPKVTRSSDDDSDSTNTTSSKHCLYFSYLHHLFKSVHLRAILQNKPSLDTVSEWALGYEDFLQIPLQPLGDNLESQIYETFERDPVKYVEYKNAVADAILYKKSLQTDDHQGSNFVP